MAVILVSDISRSIIGDTIYMTGGSGNVDNSDFGYNF
jgi:enoyl-[acyl-carrier-protein] reductase (NADH)